MGEITAIINYEGQILLLLKYYPPPHLQTLSDTTPEVARLFSLDIVSASLASIDVNSTHIDLIVAASDDPHGVIQFSVGALSVVEGEASVPVTVVRGDGLVGDVQVNFDLQLGSADQNDFSISSQCESMIFLHVIGNNTEYFASYYFTLLASP